MCYNPTRLGDGRYVACRVCKQCRESTVLDWTGRCIAERKTASAVSWLTLTYGSDMRIGGADHRKAAQLDYKDVQAFLKRLRHKYPCRYFAVGEYGSEKGRAHWHLILFWKDKVPEDIFLNKRYMWKWWPHGISFFGEVHDTTMHYVCKYLAKDDPKNPDAKFKQAKMVMSRFPPLGSAYITQLAENYVDQWLAPQDLLYQFPSNEGGKASHKFFMKGAFGDLFIKMWLLLWSYKHPGYPCPTSDLVIKWTDRHEPEEIAEEWSVLPQQVIIEEKARRAKRPPKPIYAPPGWDDFSFSYLDIPFDPVANTYWVWHDGARRYFRVDEGGREVWEATLRTALAPPPLSRAKN